MRGKHLRKRPWWKRPGPLVVILAVLLGAAGGAWAATRSGSSATAAAKASTSTSRPLPAASTGATTGATTGARTGATTSAAPSTSVLALPSPTTVTVGPPVSAPGSLTYTMASGMAIKVVASNSCWIEVRTIAHGPITQVTTLQAGQVLSLPSPLWIRLGNPANVHVTAGTTELQLPSGPGDLIINSE
jgi:hypothetical protein